MQKKMIDWLHSATTGQEKSLISITNKGGFGTDNYRIHIVNSDIPDYVDSELVAVQEELEIQDSFLINPKYLIDALNVFSESVLIDIYIDVHHKVIMIGLSDEVDSEFDNDKEAFIMCKKRDEKWEEKMQD